MSEEHENVIMWSIAEKQYTLDRIAKLELDLTNLVEPINLAKEFAGWTVSEKEDALNRIQYLEKTIEALLKKIGV